MEIRGQKVAGLIELRGVYDGWSVAVLEDGTQVNRWTDNNGDPLEGVKRRYEVTEAFLNGEEPNGRWY